MPGCSWRRTYPTSAGIWAASTSSLQDGGDHSLRVGAIILATGAELYDPRGEYGYGELPNVITSEELEKAFCEVRLGSRRQRAPAGKCRLHPVCGIAGSE